MNQTSPLSSEAGTKVLQRSGHATAELGEIRRDEVDGISRRLERICRRRMHWDQFFGVMASLFLGGFLGGLVALIPFYSQEPAPRGYWQVIYAISLGAGLLLAMLCFAAWLGIKKERSESVSDIKDDLDRILASYDAVPAESTPSSESVSV